MVEKNGATIKSTNPSYLFNKTIPSNRNMISDKIQQAHFSNNKKGDVSSRLHRWNVGCGSVAHGTDSHAKLFLFLPLRKEFFGNQVNPLQVSLVRKTKSKDNAKLLKLQKK